MLELEYIEVVGAAPAATRADISPQLPVASPVVSESRPISQPNDTDIETEFERTFNNNSANKVATSGKSAIRNLFNNRLFKTNDDTIKSDLATYIEKNAPPVEAWGYLLMLEQCENNSQLSILMQEIQNTSTGNLARGMNDFIKRIQH